jgi:hypothetical protein
MNEIAGEQALLTTSYDELPALIDSLTLSLNEWIRLAFHAIEIDHIGLLDRLLASSSVPILVVNDTGFNLLHAAVAVLSENGVECILEKAGYQNGLLLFLATNNQGETPLDMAVRKEDARQIITSFLHADFVQGSTSSPEMQCVTKAAGNALPYLVEYMSLIIRGKEVCFRHRFSHNRSVI